jgi:ferredoxin
MTRVRADMNLCQSSVQCELVALEIPELGEGVLRWKVAVYPSLRQKALEAVEACPIQAIRAEVDAMPHPERLARAVVAA